MLVSKEKKIHAGGVQVRAEPPCYTLMLNSHLSKDFNSYSGVQCASRHKDGASLMALTGFDVGSFVCMMLYCSPVTPLRLSA